MQVVGPERILEKVAALIEEFGADVQVKDVALVVKPGDGKKLVKVEKRGNNEVDLEKQKKELDHTTRGLLKGVFWGLRAVVWILGILANALARLIILLSESISGKR